MMEYGRRLFPQVVDHLALTEPNRIFASIPKSPTELSTGFQDVTMARLAMMVNSLAKWLEDRIGTNIPTTEFRTIAYAGPSDIRYTIIFLAIIKIGAKAFFISPRNQIPQNKRLLELSGSKALFLAEEILPSMATVQKESPNIPSFIIPSLQDLLTTPDDVPHYAYDITFAEAEKNPCLVLHSSGSTGDPKLVTMTHGTFAVTDNDRYMKTPEGRAGQNGTQFNFDDGGRFYSCFPPYHLAGFHAYVTLPIFSTTATVVLGPSSLAPSGYLLSEILKIQPVRAFYVPPFIVEQWSAEPIANKQALSLDFILYGGGPIAPTTGDRLSKVTRVCQMYGSLEIGQVQLLVPTPENWSYMEMNPFEECDMQPVGDGTFELVLHQNPKLARHRSLCHNFPDIKTWRTGDLFMPHPTKEGHYRFHARADDMIVFSTSYKLRPADMENVIQGSPLIAGAIIVGQGHPEPLLIIEPTPGGKEIIAASFIDEVWPSIQAANKIAPTYAQIDRSNIILADASRPFPRAPKGTIIRKLTIKEYEKEIEEAYLPKPTPETNTGDGLFESYLLPAVEQWVADCVHAVMPDISISDTDNMLIMGMDSLSGTALNRNLKMGIASFSRANSGGDINLRLIYQNPTIKQLAAAIFKTIILGQSDNSNKDSETGVEEIANLVETTTNEFIQHLPLTKIQVSISTTDPEKLTVAIIGPRGSLGSNIVRELSQNPRIVKIYCLDRGNDGEEKLRDIFRDRNWSWKSSKSLVFMPIDLDKPKLGLSNDNYQEILENANIVVHNEWKVDFGWTLESFKTQYLQSIIEVANLSHQSKLNARIVFISSIASVQEWDTVYSTPVTEKPLNSYNVVSRLGYGQSTHVAERLLTIAAQSTGIPVTIIRVGLVAGPTVAIGLGGDVWASDKCIPALATISKMLNLIPEDFAPIDWIPVDVASKSICDLSLVQNNTTSNDLAIFNLVNPQLSEWSLFANALEHRIGGSVTKASLKDWVISLECIDLDSLSDGDATLIVKMLPYFHQLAEISAKGLVVEPEFDMTKAMKASPSLVSTDAVSQKLIDLWLEQWNI